MDPEPLISPEDAEQRMRIPRDFVEFVDREAAALNLDRREFLTLLSCSYADRCSNAYEAEAAHLLRETQALEYRVEQLTLSTLTLAEAVAGLEGAAIRALIQTTIEAKALFAGLEKGRP